MAHFFKLVFCLFLFSTALSHVKLQAQQYILVIPCDMGVLNKSYQYSPDLPLDALNCWQLADKTLQQYGLTLFVTYLEEFSETYELNDLLSNSEKIIFCNLPYFIPNWKEKIAKLPKEKLILVAYEPPSVMPEMYTKEAFALFGKVLTWDDSLVDNEKFFKFNYHVMSPMVKDAVPFSKKKLLTQISGNKTSSHPDELYSERVKAIKYFEKIKGDDFDFYGTGWGGMGFRNYKGKVKDKIAVLKKYKFSICYENIKNIKGYITEKIFDCFQAGVVPIYWGASNVKDYIPSNCFIAREDFPTLRSLVRYLKNMKKQEYNHYLDNIRAYLNSCQAKQFSNEAFANSLLNSLDIIPNAE